ncbi:MAG: hypothetical protein LBS36_05245 [Oscillospiraceae bacterium]|jgi:hypothetical protein|nr:hypothetical protein [Oscillospiraceae bacterium]
MSNRLIIVKNEDCFDATRLVESYQWSGRKDSAARTLRVVLADHETLKDKRTGIDVEEGHQCVFLHDGKELFRGMFMRQEQNQKRMMTLTAYDNGIYLSNNKDSFSYTNKTASFVFRDVCTRFGIPFKDVADTKYIVEELPKPMTTGFDVICDALETTHDATGKRYSVVCENGTLRLIRRTDNMVQWVIGSGENLTSFTYSRDIEKIKTRIKLLGKDNSVAAQRINSEIEKKIGIFQEVSSAGTDLTQAKLTELIDSMMKEQGEPERVLSLDAEGIPEIVSGLCVFVKIPYLDLKRSFYVESDSHSFQGGRHTMKLTLKAVSEFDFDA